MEEPLSNFVKYKNTIDKLSLDSLELVAIDELNSILNTLKSSDFNENIQQSLNTHKDKILNDISDFNKSLDDFKNDASEFISTQEHSYLAKSYQIYEDGINQDSPEYILDRALFKSLIYRDEIEKYFISRIKEHSKWQYAGMFIRPEHGKYIDEMTASDPLYVVDEHIDLLQPTKLLWNEQYQSRVRYKIINEQQSEIFKGFPKNQMNLVVVMDFFNHRPLAVIEQYMIEIYDLLMDGGVVIMTYNNCGLALAIKNFEKSLYSYTPETRLIPLVERIGFTVVESYNEETTNVSWLEIKKPGELNTIRGGQCIAEVNI